MEITKNQSETLKRLLSGPANIGSSVAGKLKSLGYVEASGNGSGRRGLANVKITDAGRAAVA